MANKRVTYISFLEVPTRGASLVNIVKMCKALEANGVDLQVLMPTKDVVLAGRDLEQFNLRLKNIKFISLRFSRLGYLIKSLRASSVWGGLIYTRSVEVAFLASLIGKKSVLELHSPHRERNVLVQWMLNFLALGKSVLLFVPISEALRELLIEIYNFPKERIVVAHDGSDLPEKVSGNISRSVTNVGYVGHLYKGRGIEVILSLAEKFQHLTFHLIGGDEEQVNFWKSKKVSRNVIFYGHLGFEDASSLRCKMDVLLAPYQPKTLTRAGVDSTQWMSPLKIFEYMASGVPFIASDLPVLREVLSDRRNCLLVHPTDVQEWERALACLQTDVELRRSLSEKAQMDIEDKYSWFVRAQLILKRLS